MTPRLSEKLKHKLLNYKPCGCHPKHDNTSWYNAVFMFVSFGENTGKYFTVRERIYCDECMDYIDKEIVKGKCDLLISPDDGILLYDGYHGVGSTERHRSLDKVMMDLTHLIMSGSLVVETETLIYF